MLFSSCEDYIDVYVLYDCFMFGLFLVVTFVCFIVGISFVSR